MVTSAFRTGADVGWVEGVDQLPTTWHAQWISPTAEPTPAGRRPAYRLRGGFETTGPVRRATLHATAHGIYEAELNGVRVGDVELAPGFSEYQHHTQVQAYDVTDLVREGANTLDALLADGWYRGQVGVGRASDQWGTETAFLAQLEVEHADGSTSYVGTDESWQWSPSHITLADLIEGQHEDRRLVGEASWAPVATSERPCDALVTSPAPPVRAVQELKPVSVTELRPGVHVVDLGQNINGHVRLTDLGPEGTELVLTHAEWLGPDGDVTTDHLKPDLPFLPEPLAAGMVDRVVSAGVTGDAFEPRFTTHGFQYVRIEGHPGPLTADDVTGVVVHSDLEPRGGFRCSDERLDRLHEAAVWSLRGNVCDVPTDCPTRERAAWTGDWQLFGPTATYLYDVDGFSRKWLRDLVATQWEDGTLCNMAPMPAAERTGFMATLNGSAGWGDAIVLVPWELFREYGDPQVLRDAWPAIVRWLDRAERMASTQRHPDRKATHPEPRPHDRYLWDTGFHWGEWLVPGEDPGDFPAFIAADKGDTATAFYAWSTRHAAEIARLVGEDDAAERYAELSARVVDAWRTEYVVDGRVTPHTQANLVRALAFGLLPGELRQRAADDLVALVRETGNHLGTGFLATPDLLPVLADHGHLDTAYDLLLQDTAPSWLAMIDRGATTVWERWEGIDEDGVPHESLNHYSKGAVISFLHRYVAGLQRLEPTWTRFRVAPRPGGGITSAETEHLTPHGRIAVAWDAADGFALTVDVPEGTTAEVVLPDGTEHELGAGRHSLESYDLASEVPRLIARAAPPRLSPR